MSTKATVAIVDDDPGALCSLAWMIQQAKLRVRSFGSGQEFLNCNDLSEIGCVVLDVRMPGLTGLEVQKRLLERGTDLPIIFITAFGDVSACAEAFKTGAFDFLEKPVNYKVLLEHIRNALAFSAERGVRVSPALFIARLATLTHREKEVLDLLVTGKTLKEIAAAKNVTTPTIWRHQSSLLKKMGVENDLQLVSLAAAASYRSRH